MRRETVMLNMGKRGDFELLEFALHLVSLGRKKAKPKNLLENPEKMGRPLAHQERERKLDLRNWKPPHPMEQHNQPTAVYQILKQTAPSSVRIETPRFSVSFMIESP